MRTLSPNEKRTVQRAALAMAIYLALFFGWKGWKAMESKRSECEQLLLETQRLKWQVQPYENKVLLAQKLKEVFRIDPQKLSKATLVAEASAAIQKAAGQGGVQVGPIREAPARASSRELASMQLEAMGPVPALMTLLHRLETLGYPMVVDSLQLSQDATKPGMLKVNLTIVILNFEAWKTEERPHA